MASKHGDSESRGQVARVLPGKRPDVLPYFARKVWWEIPHSKC